MTNVFKAEITYEAVRPFKYTADVKFNRGDPILFIGLPNDDKLISTGLVRPHITYFCRQPRCAQSFTSISELMRHENDEELHKRAKPKVIPEE